MQILSKNITELTESQTFDDGSYLMIDNTDWSEAKKIKKSTLGAILALSGATKILTDGNVDTWRITSLAGSYADIEITNSYPTIAEFSIDGATLWHSTVDNTTDKYIRFSYDNGTTWSDAIAINIVYVPENYSIIGDSNNKPAFIESVVAPFLFGTFTGDYLNFSYAENWVDNTYIGAAITGHDFDIFRGTFSDGSTGDVTYAQSGGWKRRLYTNFINDSTTLGGNIANWLKTSSTFENNATAESSIAGFGDIGQEYFYNNTLYRCIYNNGTLHRWIRYEPTPNSIEVSNITYIPYKKIVFQGETSIPNGYKILDIYVSAPSTDTYDITIGTTLGASNICNFSGTITENIQKKLVIEESSTSIFIDDNDTSLIFTIYYIKN